MSTKAENILNPNSCWNKAANEEPIFVLRSTDTLAPDLIRTWAALYRSRHREAWSADRESKYNDALRCADAMTTYNRTVIDDDIPF